MNIEFDSQEELEKYRVILAPNEVAWLMKCCRPIAYDPDDIPTQADTEACYSCHRRGLTNPPIPSPFMQNANTYYYTISDVGRIVLATYLSAQ